MILKTASAIVQKPDVSRDYWSRSVRHRGHSRVRTASLVNNASEILGGPLDLSKYLLTHATIVCSVDTYSPKGSKIGSVMVDGFKVNRKYSNFRIKSGSQKRINSNFDAWDRAVLLKSFKTFIGAHNFQEHVQVEDLSKGRILDAVARDVGDSIYIDILIATDRKHTELIRDIESGKLGTLSMGCLIEGSICTKCGHWAADEAESCPHIKHEKGTTFYDEDGQPNVVAELCGHESIAPTGGVQFIEASWVAVPAFKGAVLRNIVQPSANVARRAQKVFSSAGPDMKKVHAAKAARLIKKAAWGRGGDDEEEEEEASSDDGFTPLQDAERDLEQFLVDRAKVRVKEMIQDRQTVLVPNSAFPNSNLQREARYRKVARVVGHPNEYRDYGSFVYACSRVLGYTPSRAEVRRVASLGQINSKEVNMRDRNRRSMVGSRRRYAGNAPATPGYGTADQDHPAYRGEPGYRRYQKGDPEAWMSTRRDGPYPEGNPPALPGYDTADQDHPAYIRPYRVEKLSSVVQRKAHKCLRLASHMLGKGASTRSIERKALSLMDLSDRSIEAGLRRLASGFLASDEDDEDFDDEDFDMFDDEDESGFDDEDEDGFDDEDDLVDDDLDDEDDLVDDDLDDEGEDDLDDDDEPIATSRYATRRHYARQRIEARRERRQARRTSLKAKDESADFLDEAEEEEEAPPKRKANQNRYPGPTLGGRARTLEEEHEAVRQVEMKEEGSAAAAPAIITEPEIDDPLFEDDDDLFAPEMEGGVLASDEPDEESEIAMDFFADDEDPMGLNAGEDDSDDALLDEIFSTQLGSSEEEMRSIEAALKPQPKQRSTGFAGAIGSMSRTASSDKGDDLSRLWKTAPDVSKVFE